MHATAGVSRAARAAEKRTLSTRVCGGYCLAVGAALQRMPLTGRTSLSAGALLFACVGARCLFARACACLRRAMFELLRRQQLDLLGAFYADNVNDGMRGNVRAHLLLAAPRAMRCRAIAQRAARPGPACGLEGRRQCCC